MISWGASQGAATKEGRGVKADHHDKSSTDVTSAYLKLCQVSELSWDTPLKLVLAQVQNLQIWQLPQGGGEGARKAKARELPARNEDTCGNSVVKGLRYIDDEKENFEH